jgi:hypothetical protein
MKSFIISILLLSVSAVSFAGSWVPNEAETIDIVRTYKSGNYKKFKKYIRKGLNVNALVGVHKDTPLLNYIMGVKFRDENNVFYPATKNHFKILDLLKKNGLNLNVQRLLADQRFAISWTTDLGVLKWMLKNGARLDIMQSTDLAPSSAFGQLCRQGSDSASKQILDLFFPYILGELGYDIYENGKCHCYKNSAGSHSDYIWDNYTGDETIHDTWVKCTDML